MLFAQTPTPPKNPAFADQPEATPPDTEAEKVAAQIESVQTRIREAYKQNPPPYEDIAAMYDEIFAIAPHQQAGKAAVWESYVLYRRAGDSSAALSTLSKIYAFYPYDTTMDNPVDPEHPINMRATADIERAGLYSESLGSPMTAVEQMQSISVRYPGTYVGLTDEERSYAGPVDVIVMLKFVDALYNSGQYNQAVLKLRELLGKYAGQKVGDAGGLREIDWLAARHMDKIIDKIPATTTKKLVELEELAKLTTSDLALAEILFTRAKIYEERFVELKGSGDLAQAEEAYRGIITQYAELRYETYEGEQAVGPRAVAAMMRLYTEKAKRPERALNLALELEKIGQKADPTGATSAYARLHRGALYLNELNNPQQAITTFRGFGEDFPAVVVYPHREKSPELLFEVAKRLENQARETLLETVPAPHVKDAP
ncbi:MAG: tetratricopeptide repeat protein [Deltaproteobacteria bacterium]|nr:tetratricopeptide repeat protein [Deltaproteobacteria bacterium]